VTSLSTLRLDSSRALGVVERIARVCQTLRQRYVAPTIILATGVLFGGCGKSSNTASPVEIDSAIADASVADASIRRETCPMAGEVMCDGVLSLRCGNDGVWSTETCPGRCVDGYGCSEDCGGLHELCCGQDKVCMPGTQCTAGCDGDTFCSPSGQCSCVGTVVDYCDGVACDADNPCPEPLVCTEVNGEAFCAEGCSDPWIGQSTCLAGNVCFPAANDVAYCGPDCRTSSADCKEIPCNSQGYCDCEEDELRCDGNLCVQQDAICDGLVDCIDFADELSCNGECAPNAFPCDDYCLLEEYVCDGYADCLGDVDEEGCPCQATCDDGTCIAESLLCDYEPNCVGSEDELDCTCAPNDFVCPEGRCLRSGQVCDLIDDCFDGEDELNCP
jgi:hypothetical protein